MWVLPISGLESRRDSLCDKQLKAFGNDQTVDFFGTAPRYAHDGQMKGEEKEVWMMGVLR